MSSFPAFDAVVNNSTHHVSRSGAGDENWKVDLFRVFPRSRNFNAAITYEIGSLSVPGHKERQQRIFTDFLLFRAEGAVETLTQDSNQDRYTMGSLCYHEVRDSKRFGILPT